METRSHTWVLARAVHALKYWTISPSPSFSFRTQLLKLRPLSAWGDRTDWMWGPWKCYQQCKAYECTTVKHVLMPRRFWQPWVMVHCATSRRPLPRTHSTHYTVRPPTTQHHPTLPEIAQLKLETVTHRNCRALTVHAKFSALKET